MVDPGTGGAFIRFPSEAELVRVAEPACLLHPQAVADFQALCGAAAEAGFSLAVASSYRSIERQCLIWNGKANGSRPVLDSQGQPLDITRLDDYQQVQAILRWSALPGASRHHWGTDLDVYDKAAVAGDYRLQLTCGECEGDGPFSALHRWLDERISRGESFGFYRPYQEDRGGVAPEPWHLSHRPSARYYEQRLDRHHLQELIASLPIALKPVVLQHFDDIYSRFIALDGALPSS